MLALLLSIIIAIANPAISPRLTDVTGQLRIGCGFDGAMSAPLVCRGRKPIGVYLDDSTPNLDYWVAKAKTKYWYVLVARPPGHWDCPWSGVRCAHEVYSCNNNPTIQRAARYILQDRYALPGCRAPGPRGAAVQLQRVLRYRPALVLVY